MAKRNKNLAKSRKSALRVEALEQRQLLAAVTGGGTEVGTDIHHANGNVFDQVLATGASVTVTADAGQITRVSFLDLNGDIVQAEFSGAGTLNVAFDSASLQTNVAPAGYNQDVKYVQGLASFTIQGSDASTNFQVFSVGKGNAVNQSLFDATHNGGNGLADIARLLVVANPLNPQGSTMGSIRAANAIFADSTGTVGIAAANVQVQNTVIVGDIIASNSAIPTLNFGINSQFGVVQVAGGSLQSPNGTAIQDNSNTLPGAPAGYQYGLNYVDGTKSSYVQGSDKTEANGYIKAKVFDANLVTFQNGGHLSTTIDTSTEISLTGKTQAELNTIFNGRTFVNDVKITGVLDTGFAINAAAFRGNVEFTGEVKGNITLTDVNGVAQPVAAFGKTLTFDEKVSGNITAESFGDIVAKKDFAAVVTSGDGMAGTLLDGKIGNITIGTAEAAANLTGRFAADWSIGNINVTGNITTNANVFTTNGNNAAQLGDIGTLTVAGDVDLSNTANRLINITGQGTFGDVTIAGGGALGKLDATDDLQIGSFVVAALGAGQNKVGKISITEDATKSSDISLGAVSVGTGGTIQDITITGGGAAKSDLTFAGAIGDANDAVSKITASGFNDITVNAAIAGASISEINLATIAGTMTDASSITLNAGVTVAETLGKVDLNAGADNSAVTFGADITAKDLTSLKSTAKTTTLNAGFGVVSTNSVGTIDVVGNAVLAGGNIAVKGLTALTVSGTTSLANATGATAADAAISATGTVGDITLTGDVSINAAAGAVINTTGGAISGALTFGKTTTAATSAATALLTADVGAVKLGDTNLSASAAAFLIADDGTAANDVVGSLTIGKFVGNASNEFQASKFGDISISQAFSTAGETLVTGLNVVAAQNTDAAADKGETVARDGSNLGDYTIGNITITDTQTEGYANSSLFGGTNSFVALGGIGNIKLAGGGTENQQTQLFAAAATASFIAGPTGAVDFNGDTMLAGYGSGASAVTAAQETNADFTAGTVSVGNVDINTARIAPTAAQPNNSDTIRGSEGLLVAAGVRVGATDGTVANIGYQTVDRGDGVTPTTTTGSLAGNIGNIRVYNNSQVLTVSQADTAADGTAASQTAFTFTAGAKIVASGKVGTVQGQFTGSTTANILDGDGEYAIIGNEAADADIADTVSGELIVYVV